MGVVSSDLTKSGVAWDVGDEIAGRGARRSKTLEAQSTSERLLLVNVSIDRSAAMDLNLTETNERSHVGLGIYREAIDEGNPAAIEGMTETIVNAATSQDRPRYVRIYTFL